ncbi:MAG: hypothetical protein AAB263_10420 [Planctomycetota bacterium]
MKPTFPYTKSNMYTWRFIGTVVLLSSGISIGLQIQKYGYADSAVNQQVLLLVIATLLVQEFVAKCRQQEVNNDGR